MAKSYPGTDCPACGTYVPCRDGTLVLEPKNQLGKGRERWISLESPRDALVRHLRDDCKGQ